MPKISAIIHTHNDALRIGRALDSLRGCDEVIIVDHGSEDHTRNIARKHGATVKKSLPGVEPGAYMMDARFDWIFCLSPHEALSESLEASLLEFRERPADEEKGTAYNVTLREERGSDWRPLAPETRLANRSCLNWTSEFPPNIAGAPTLTGELLRFEEPRRIKSA
ncbi:MAG: glycosyltransferase [Candidatus Koribacter versatilis]|uniref:Glycosyltransferase n=1 Tax=Candidatus Korobacter versatilis TaxID=658062 RepID=A0A932A624_9BACT|nr:glycosyltransferase [Candidatus Koribacter versatilis]